MKRTKTPKKKKSEIWESKILQHLYSKPGRTTHLRKILQSVYGIKIESVFSLMLDRHSYMKEKQGSSYPNRFKMPQQQIEYELGISRFMVRETITQLESMCLLSHSEHGMPKSRHYRINFEQLWHIISKYQELKNVECDHVECRTHCFHRFDELMFPEGQSSIVMGGSHLTSWGAVIAPHGGQSLPPIYKENKDKENRKIKKSKSHSPRPSGIAESVRSKEKKELIQSFMFLANQLKEIVHSQKNIKITTSQIKSWATELANFHKTAKVSKERMEAALDWYEDHAGEEYVPVIFSGKAFRDKFTKLEDAIKRGSRVKNKRTGGRSSARQDENDLRSRNKQEIEIEITE